MPQHAYDEWFEQIRNDKSQFNIHVTDEWIIQIAYDKLIIMAKSEMDQYILDRICIRKPGTYEFNDYQIDIHPDLHNSYIRLLCVSDKMEMCIN